MLHSILAIDGAAVHVHYLHGPSFPVDLQRRLTRMVQGMGGNISFIAIPDQWIAGLAAPGGHQTLATWYRIFLPALLPQVDRILYLDGDTLAVESVAPLWELDLGDAYVAAVTNVFEPWFLHRPGVLGLTGPQAYFNAGILLMNLDLMRKDGSTEALLNYSLDHIDKLMWVDQDALNVVLGHRRHVLRPRWNCMNAVIHLPWATDAFAIEELEEARTHPAIRHFEGPPVCKPWHYLCEQSMRDLYFEHRQQTPWPDVRIEGRTPRAIVSRLLRDARLRVASARAAAPPPGG
jgi:lipopolysaccharide biosynthesis glycosyltransferase